MRLEKEPVNKNMISHSSRKNFKKPKFILKKPSMDRAVVMSLPNKKPKNVNQINPTIPRQTKSPKNFYSNYFSRINTLPAKRGKKSNKNGSNRTIMKARIPIVIEDVTKWSEATNRAIKLMNSIWKLLLMVDPQESTIEIWAK